jgi:hypothetical protein
VTINNELHARALREFGRGYLSPTNTGNVLGIIFDRIDRAESTITETRSALSKHFNDIKFDGEGKPNSIEDMVQLAGEQRRSLNSWADNETERADLAERKLVTLRSRFNIELAARTYPTPDEPLQVLRIPELVPATADASAVMLAKMAGHPDPGLHPDKYCSRCSLPGHESDDCHIAAPDKGPTP